MEGVYSKEEYSKAYTELLIILKSISREELIKIPHNVIQFYLKNRDKNHKFIYDASLEFKEQNIMHLTMVLFANIYLQYLATDEIREKIKKQDKEELIRLEAERQELYSVDKLFKKRAESQAEVRKEMQITIVEKKNIFSKIIEKVKKILKLT